MYVIAAQIYILLVLEDFLVSYSLTAEQYKISYIYIHVLGHFLLELSNAIKASLLSRVDGMNCYFHSVFGLHTFPYK